MANRFRDPAACVDEILERVGPTLRVGAPLGAGKPNHLLNEIYRRAKQDPNISLTIYTALTLNRPKGRSLLESRFLEPLADRVFADYPDIDFETDRQAGTLPENVKIHEFYFPAGKLSGNAQAQRDYISTNYTFVARDLADRGVNVMVQQVARRDGPNGEELSLSCNADVTHDLLRILRERELPAVAVAQTNEQLPFMLGDARVEPDFFDLVVDNRELDYAPFGPPKMSVDDQEYMMGLYASALVKDGGELQIGIGALADALIYGLVLRHEQNDTYRKALSMVGAEVGGREVMERLGDLEPFQEGLFAATEMFVDGFLELFDRDILRRRVYGDVALQRLLNSGEITETVTEDTLEALVAVRAVHGRLTRDDVDYLVRFGVLRPEVTFEDGDLILPNGSRVVADLLDDVSRAEIEAHGLGDRLKGGVVMHAGFFLGPPAFYKALREMPEERRALIDMRSVMRVNELFGEEELDRLHRKDARFVNTGMMVTLLGAVVSDALEDGRVISGVGGQYNFVAMAHALPDGRSILQVRSTREEHGEVKSNVVWSYGHTTIPRHLRDIVITEYGIADLRGKSDEECVMELLAVADSRFQPALMAEAKGHGKLREDYEIPEERRNNFPERYQEALRALRKDGLFSPFPFGTDLTETEKIVGRALRALKGRTETGGGTIMAMADAAVHGQVGEDVAPYLERMGLLEAHGAQEKIYQRLLAASLRKVLAETAAAS